MSQMTSRIKSFMQPAFQSTQSSTVLLILRLVMGIAFILHGWDKIQAPFSWMPPEAGIPGILQFLAAFSEVGGGLALILGLLTSLAMLGLGITMAVATHFHAVIKGDPFVGREGSYELALLYLVLSILFIVMGPGQYSADAKIFGQKK